MSLLAEYSEAFKRIKQVHNKEDFELTRRAMSIVSGVLPYGSIPMPVFSVQEDKIKVREFLCLKIRVNGVATPTHLTTKIISNSKENYITEFSKKIIAYKKAGLDMLAEQRPSAFIANYTKLHTVPAWLKKYTDEATAQKLAAQVQEELLYKPSDNTILSTPQEYASMCDDRLSCMAVDSTNHASTFRTYMWDKFKLWPSLFFYYCPYLQGAVIKNKETGRTAARGTINLNGGYMSVYSDNSVHRLKLERDLGDYHKKNELKTREDFVIPAFELSYNDGRIYYICPLAYHDVIHHPYYIYFNREKKEFNFVHYTPKMDGWRYLSISDNTYGYKGWVVNYDGGTIRSCAEYLSTTGIKDVKLPY